MPRDYAALVRALRAKAADPVVPDTERAALLERAKDIERRHPESVTVNSRFTDYTATTTSRSGQQTWRGPTKEQVWDTLWNLHRNQHKWNPPDEANLVEDDYAYQPEDEDYGYDIYEGENY